MWLLIAIVILATAWITIQVAGSAAENRCIDWMFVTHVAGVTFRNKDHRSRQKIIRESCYVGQWLKLVPEPENKQDDEAIAVYLATGEQIGYLRQHVTRSSSLDGCVAKVIEIQGGTRDKPSVGVAIRIGRYKENSSKTGEALAKD